MTLKPPGKLATYRALQPIIERQREIQETFKSWQHQSLETRYYLINKAMIANLDALQTISAALGSLILDESDDI